MQYSLLEVSVVKEMTVLWLYVLIKPDLSISTENNRRERCQRTGGESD